MHLVRFQAVDADLDYPRIRREKGGLLVESRGDGLGICSFYGFRIRCLLRGRRRLRHRGSGRGGGGDIRPRINRHRRRRRRRGRSAWRERRPRRTYLPPGIAAAATTAHRQIRGRIVGDLHLLQQGPEHHPHGTAENFLRQIQYPPRHAIREAQSVPRGLLGEVVAIPVEQIVGVGAEPSRGLGAAPGFELRFGARRMSQGVDIDGMHIPGRSEFVGAAPVDTLSEVILLPEGEDGSMGYDLDRVLRAEELSGEIPRHAHAEVVDGQVDLVRGGCR